MAWLVSAWKHPCSHYHSYFPSPLLIFLRECRTREGLQKLNGWPCRCFTLNFLMEEMMVWGFTPRSDEHLCVPAAHMWAARCCWGLQGGTGNTQQSRTPVRRWTPRSQSPFWRFHTFSCEAGGDALNARKRLWSPGRFPWWMFLPFCSGQLLQIWEASELSRLQNSSSPPSWLDWKRNRGSLAITL